MVSLKTKRKTSEIFNSGLSRNTNTQYINFVQFALTVISIILIIIRKCSKHDLQYCVYCIREL